MNEDKEKLDLSEFKKKYKLNFSDLPICKNTLNGNFELKKSYFNQ